MYHGACLMAAARFAIMRSPQRLAEYPTQAARGAISSETAMRPRCSLWRDRRRPALSVEIQTRMLDRLRFEWQPKCWHPDWKVAPGPQALSLLTESLGEHLQKDQGSRAHC